MVPREDARMTTYRARGRVRRFLDALKDAAMVAWRVCLAALDETL